MSIPTGPLVVKVDRARTTANELFGTGFDQFVRTYFDQIKSAIAELDVGQDEEDLDISFEQLRPVSDHLEQLLQSAGLAGLLATYAHAYPSLAASVADYFTHVGGDATLDAIPRDRLSAWVDLTAHELSKLIDTELVAPVRGVLLQTGFSATTAEKLLKQLEDAARGITGRDVSTFVDMTYGKFQRAVMVAKADDLGLEIYQYLGPDDAITSDQCETMLHVERHGAEGFLYKDEILPSLHPFLERYGIEPLTEGGHPGCRHQFVPVTLEYAMLSGFQPREESVEDNSGEAG